MYLCYDRLTIHHYNGELSPRRHTKGLCLSVSLSLKGSPIKLIGSLGKYKSQEAAPQSPPNRKNVFETVSCRQMSIKLKSFRTA